MTRFCLAFIVGLALAPGPLPTLAQATQFPGVPPILLGAAWYPEQWPESQWDADLDRMAACHIHLVRVGEFAWSTMEPAEGNYDFTWLDHAIEKAGESSHRVSFWARRPPPLPHGSPPNILRPCAWTRTAAGRSTETASSSLSPMRSIASPAHGIAEQMAMRYRAQPKRGRLAAGQRIRQSRLWAFGASPVPRMAAKEIRHHRPAQPPLDHSVLEPDLRQLR